MYFDCPAGCVLSKLLDASASSASYIGEIDTIGYRQVTYQINGTWVGAGNLSARQALMMDPLKAIPAEATGPYQQVAGIKYLISEEGYDWYALREQLQGNYFICYMADSGLIVQCETDKNMLWPERFSVAVVDAIPADLTTGDIWVSDGENIVQDSTLLSQKNQRINTRMLKQKRDDAMGVIGDIQCSAAAGNSRDDDSNSLMVLQQYVDLKQAQPAWPPVPEFIDPHRVLLICRHFYIHKRRNPER